MCEYIRDMHFNASIKTKISFSFILVVNIMKKSNFIIIVDVKRV